MKTFRGRRGPFKEQPYYTPAEIDGMCLDELRAVDLLPTEPSPVRIERFIERRFRIHPIYDDLPAGVLGFTRFGPNGVEEMKIARALDDEGTTTAERRIRTTFGHEGGHGLLHAHLFAIGVSARSLFDDPNAPDAPLILCRDEIAKDVSQGRRGYDGRWWEYQANQAMAALLLPQPLVERSLESFLVPQGRLGAMVFDERRREQAARLIADVFEVNPVVVRIRLESLHRRDDGRQLVL